MLEKGKMYLLKSSVRVKYCKLRWQIEPGDDNEADAIHIFFCYRSVSISCREFFQGHGIDKVWLREVKRIADLE